MVEHAFQRELPGARRAQRHREHRAAASGRHDRACAHHIAQRHTARGQPKAGQVGLGRGRRLERIGQRAVRTRVEQRRNAATRGQANRTRATVDIARAAFDAARKRILVNRTGQLDTRVRGRKIVGYADGYRRRRLVAIEIGRNDKHRAQRGEIIAKIGVKRIVVVQGDGDSRRGTDHREIECNDRVGTAAADDLCVRNTFPGQASAQIVERGRSVVEDDRDDRI